MKSRKTLQISVLAVLFAGLGIGALRTTEGASPAPPDRDQNKVSTQTSPTAPASTTDSFNQRRVATTSSEGKAVELASLNDMTRTLFQFTQPGSRLGDLVQYLESSQQNPQVTKDSNPATGDMVIVRTRSPLPGTRYFHAQYFSDENNQSFVQHMSFEFKPGETAMKEAVDSIQTAFRDLPTPNIQKSDFIQWKIDGGYILWIKKMGLEDLQDDPFNAYSIDDVGTVRVALELDIHDNADDSHSH